METGENRALRGQGVKWIEANILVHQSRPDSNLQRYNAETPCRRKYAHRMSFKRRMRSLPLSAIRITDPFWARRQQTLIDTTLPTQFEQLVSTGRLANFERAAGKKEGTFEGLWFNDSDVYKFAEACAYALTIRDAPTVRRCLEQVTAAIQEAQLPDGYINTFFQLKYPHLRWRNLNMMHEMYCGGHLIEAGVAVYECLGDRRLLDVSIRFAQHVMDIFGPGLRRGYSGHEEIELALIRLSFVTGEAKYQEFARWLVEQRGHSPSPFEAELTDPEALQLWPDGTHLAKDGKYNGEYCQDHAPIREHTEVVGHAVRAMYLYVAAAELADGREDAGLENALESAWTNITTRRMYITGGVGPSASNEGFTTDYDLPNLSAYAETCASCGLVFWGHKMLELTADGDYADVVERALYNGVLSGISLSGDHYFYANPLESRGSHARTPWFTCACCPPNIARLIGSLARFAVGCSDNSFYVHMPVGFEAAVKMSGTPVDIALESTYPWTGRYSIRVRADAPVRFKLLLRIPAWSGEVEIDAPTMEEPAEYEGGYAAFDRIWQGEETLSVDLKMEPEWVEANPRVRDNLGRVSLTNGPLIYAAERHDLGFAPQLLAVDTAQPIELRFERMLDGMNLLEADALSAVETPSDELYQPGGSTELREVRAKFIPFYAWGNRGSTDMLVWLREA